MAANAGPYKVALCGKVNVGKTSIFCRIQDDTFVEDMNPPQREGIQFCEVSLEDKDGRSVQIHLWDTLGMERYADLTRTHYANSKIVLLVYDCDNMDSLELLDEVYEDATTHAPEATMVLVRNKIDKQLQTVGEEEAFRKLFTGEKEQRQHKLACHIATSAMTGAGIHELRTELGNLLYNREPVVGTNTGFTLFQPPENSEDTQPSPTVCC